MKYIQYECGSYSFEDSQIDIFDIHRCYGYYILYDDGLNNNYFLNNFIHSYMNI